MQIEVNGTRLWFDVEGSSLVPDGSRMIERPTVVLVHGGPGTYDHSYFKPDFARLCRDVQVVYVDLRDHGRSARHPASDWSFEECADDLAATPVEASREIAMALRPGVGRLAVIEGAGHFTWLDQPERTWTILSEFIAGCSRAAGPSLPDGAGAG